MRTSMPIYFYDFFQTLPNFELNRPYYYLSKAQKDICARYRILNRFVDVLPCWVPHEMVARALGHGTDGINNACSRLPSSYYLWATEFENVHSFWNFEEPSFTVDGVHYQGSEDFYQSQKPFPFDAEIWDARRDDVMRAAIRHKFNASTPLQELLISTHPYPLLSIKSCSYWGVQASGEGENKLAVLLMELREELVSQRDATD